LKQPAPAACEVAVRLEELAGRYPRLYHMAEADTWPSIRDNGLLSTSAVLDHLEVYGTQREQYEARHRPTKTTISGAGLGPIILRDQKPMKPDRLSRALGAATTPEQWYRLLNEKVYFWVAEERLHNLLCAREYSDLEHDVLIIDTASLLMAHAERVWLCHMNSGTTFPYPTKRGPDAFKRIADYPTRKSGAPVKAVVEFVVDYSVPDIADHVVEVRRMKSREVLRQLDLR